MQTFPKGEGNGDNNIPPEIRGQYENLEADLANAHSLDDLLNMEEPPKPAASPEGRAAGAQEREEQEKEIRYLVFKKKCALYAQALIREMMEKGELNPQMTAAELAPFMYALAEEFQKEIKAKREAQGLD